MIGQIINKTRANIKLICKHQQYYTKIDQIGNVW